MRFCKPLFWVLFSGGMAVVSVARADVFEIFSVLQQYGTQKQSAIKVLTSQVSTAATMQMNADIALAQGSIASKALLSTTSEQIEIYRRYSALTGQGAQVCDAVNQRNDVDGIASARSAYAFTQPVNGGRAAVPRDRYESARLDKRLDAYCSADEHNLGLCKSRFDGMAAASTNYNKIVVADQFTGKQLKAVEDFVANLVPPPLPVQRASDCDVRCQMSRARAMRVDALASMVAAPMTASLSSRIGQKTFAEKK
jgi:hypothetical protein